MKKIKSIKNDASVSAVIGVILMVAITVAIAGTVYVYVSGMIDAPQEQEEMLTYKIGVPQGFYNNEYGNNIFVFNDEHLYLSYMDEDEIRKFIGKNTTLVLENYTGMYNYDYYYNGIFLNLVE